MILIAGGTGFVGTKVVHALRAAEFPVRALARAQSVDDMPADEARAAGHEDHVAEPPSRKFCQ